MPNADTHKFYEAYVTNVQDFLIAESEIRRVINRSLKEKKTLTAKVQTKVYTLLYSTFSEANFMKMILTPYGFEQSFINEILAQDSIQEKWFKCIEIAFAKFNKQVKNSEIPNKKQELKRIIQKFIIDPSILRNKIAHGQLSIAMNSKGTDVNFKTTSQLLNLDYVEIYRWFRINNKLVSIVEDLIESPNKAHHQHYYQKYQELESFIMRTNSWNSETKMKSGSMKKNIPPRAAKNTN